MLFRTHIAGLVRWIFEAFEKLKRSPNLARFVRHPSRKLFGARLKLPPGERDWDLTHIEDDLYLMIENFVYTDPRIELVPGDGLVQLNFKLTQDLTMSVSRAEPLRLNRPSLTIYRQPQGVDTSTKWAQPWRSCPAPFSWR